MANVFDTARNVGLRDVASRICGMNVNKQGTMPCPLHNEKKGASFAVRDDTYWKCFGKCGTHGDVTAFVSAVKKIPAFDAAKLICDTFGLTYDLPKREATVPATDYSFLLGNDMLASLSVVGLSTNDSVLKYLKETRRFTQATLDKYMFGYMSKETYGDVAQFVKDGKISKENYDAFSRHVGRLVIPLYNVTGKQILGFVSRALSKSDKIKYINDNDSEYQYGYHKQIYSYGLQHSTRHADVVIVEGYLDAPSFNQLGINVIAMGDCSLPGPRFNYLSKMYSKLILGLDNDWTGVKRTIESHYKFKQVNFGYVIWPAGIKDANDSLIKGVVPSYGDFYEYVLNVWKNNINDIQTNYGNRSEFVALLRSSLSFINYGSENYFVRREIDKFIETILDA